MSIHPMTELTEMMRRDPEYVWSWHCNLAMPIMDATGVSPQKANEAAAHLMQHLFGVDMTEHPHYEYGKSGAQEYAEFRLAVDRAEDARDSGSDRNGENAERSGAVEGEASQSGPKGIAQGDTP